MMPCHRFSAFSRTHAEIVPAFPRCSVVLLGAAAKLLVPLNARAAPNWPVVHVPPVIVAWLPFPELSAAWIPVPSLKAYAATMRPVVGGVDARVVPTAVPE